MKHLTQLLTQCLVHVVSSINGSCLCDENDLSNFTVIHLLHLDMQPSLTDLIRS